MIKIGLSLVLCLALTSASSFAESDASVRRSKATRQFVAEVFASQVRPSKALKMLIVKAAIDYLYDPYSVRDAEISSVVTLNKKSGLQAVCVKGNAKNRFGAYVGRQAVAVHIQNGTLAGTFPEAPGCYRKGLKYYPFPELEAL